MFFLLTSALMGDPFSGKLILSAHAGGYSNMDWYFDDTNPQELAIAFYLAAETITTICSNSTVIYTNVTTAPAIGALAGHITTGSNVAGFTSFGIHGYYGSTNAGYATNGTILFSGQSAWYIMQTIESFNGMRCVSSTGQGNFVQWFSGGAFGGAEYSNTPVGAMCNVDEPGEQPISCAATYFGYWAAAKNAGICAWAACNTPYLQVVGDPLVRK